MKLNISFPSNGTQKTFDFDNEQAVRPFFDKRMSAEVEGDSLGDEWKGYVFRITGGNDKQGFCLTQGVLTNKRVRLLLAKGSKGYIPRRTGERKRKSVRGCIVDAQLSVLNLAIIKKGEKEIPGLTDTQVPRRLGPKRASKIRKLFNLSKKDDVRKYVIRRKIEPKKEGKKPYSKAPRIQRLVTPQTLQRKRHRVALKKQRAQKQKTLAANYAKLLAKHQQERREARHLAHQKRRSSHKSESKA
eukprot:m.219735 g.219735  ORF g.219735 m.219735 type:complete len:244 (+) comp10233_c0_seq1:109-840(+)